MKNIISMLIGNKVRKTVKNFVIKNRAFTKYVAPNMFFVFVRGKYDQQDLQLSHAITFIRCL